MDANCSCTFQDTSYLPATCAASLALFMAVVDSALRSRCDIAEPCSRRGRDDLALHGTQFDFVVVGAGAAGPVVASRLAENPAWSVLLLEAGPEEPTTTAVPGFSMASMGSAVDWNYTTVRQQNACLNSGGVCKWPRGKMVSGTNAMNGMMYNRGHRSIYDDWAALGNDGWGYQDVLPYFIKSENNLDPEHVDEGYHGHEGPLTVQRFPQHPPLTEDVIAAAKELGYRQGDLTGANQTGINIAQMMLHEGLRASTGRMYLRRGGARPNLAVAINSHVVKVLVKRGAATGVQFLDRRGRRNSVRARKEVILCAGAIGSAQLLLLSGIGPKKDLRKLGIKVLADLPVGKNLHNHVATAVTFHINETAKATLTRGALQTFLDHRDGPLASTGLTQTTGFFLSKYAKNGVPDLQVFFDGYKTGCSRTGSNEECDGAKEPPCGKRVITARPTNIHPLSVGQLKLRSADPLEYPAIDPQYLSVQEDVDVLVDGVRLVTRMTRTQALRRWGFQLDRTPAEGCAELAFDTDEYWRCVVRRATGPEHHQVGTCRMGPAGDPRAVVDPRLRVHGVRNLRVVDSSVFPYPPNSNTAVPIIMAAEKLADMVKQTWRSASDTVSST